MIESTQRKGFTMSDDKTVDIARQIYDKLSDENFALHGRTIKVSGVTVAAVYYIRDNTQSLPRQTNTIYLNVFEPFSGKVLRQIRERKNGFPFDLAVRQIIEVYLKYLNGVERRRKKSTATQQARKILDSHPYLPGGMSFQAGCAKDGDNYRPTIRLFVTIKAEYLSRFLAGIQHLGLVDVKQERQSD